MLCRSGKLTAIVSGHKKHGRKSRGFYGAYRNGKKIAKAGGYISGKKGVDLIARKKEFLYNGKNEQKRRGTCRTRSLKWKA